MNSKKHCTLLDKTYQPKCSWVFKLGSWRKEYGDDCNENQCKCKILLPKSKAYHPKCSWVFKCGKCSYESNSKPRMIWHLKDIHEFVHEEEKIEDNSQNLP